MSLVSILKKTDWKSCQDVSRRPKERSEYSDQVLAQHYENYREIIENIKTRPRLPLPPVTSFNIKRKSITWSEASLKRLQVTLAQLQSQHNSVETSCDKIGQVR